MRGIRGPSKSGGGWLANNEATPYNLLRCPMHRPQVARESGTAGKLQWGAALQRKRFPEQIEIASGLHETDLTRQVSDLNQILRTLGEPAIPVDLPWP